MNCWHCKTELIWGGDHDLDDKASASNIVQADDDYNQMKTGKGSIRTRLAERYGGDWSKKEGDTFFTNEKGEDAQQAEKTYLDASKNVG